MAKKGGNKDNWGEEIEQKPNCALVAHCIHYYPNNYKKGRLPLLKMLEDTMRLGLTESSTVLSNGPHRRDMYLCLTLCLWSSCGTGGLEHQGSSTLQCAHAQNMPCDSSFENSKCTAFFPPRGHILGSHRSQKLWNSISVLLAELQ